MMSRYLPIQTSGLGTFLIEYDYGENGYPTIPLFRIQSTRVPIISTLNPDYPRYRLVSFVVGPFSSPVCHIRCHYSTVCERHEQRLHSVDLQVHSSMNQVLRETQIDVIPVLEDGVCVRLLFEYETPRFQLSKTSYELFMQLCRLLSYLDCFEMFQECLGDSFDLSPCYEATPSPVVRFELMDTECVLTNGVYESLARLMCGSNREPLVDVHRRFRTLVKSFTSLVLVESSTMAHVERMYVLHRMQCRRLFRILRRVMVLLHISSVQYAKLEIVPTMAKEDGAAVIRQMGLRLYTGFHKKARIGSFHDPTRRTSYLKTFDRFVSHQSVCSSMLIRANQSLQIYRAANTAPDLDYRKERWELFANTTESLSLTSEDVNAILEEETD